MLDCAFSPSLRTFLAGLCFKTRYECSQSTVVAVDGGDSAGRVVTCAGGLYKFACAENFFLLLFSPDEEENYACELTQNDEWMKTEGDA